MADVRITISLVPGTTRLHLTDSNGNSGVPTGFITQVSRGDLVIWELAPDSGIDALTGIRAKDGKFDIFNNSDPKNRPDGTWAGKIKDDAAGSDSYDIDYRVGGKSYTEDPDLDVKPPK